MSESGSRFCENCGTEIRQTTNFCPNCGAAQRPDLEVPTGPPPSVPEPGRINTPNVPGVPPPTPNQPGGGGLWGSPRRSLLTLLVIVVLLIIVGRGCGGGTGSTSNSTTPSKEDTKSSATNTPDKAKKKAANEVAVRVLGTKGVEFSGSYGTTQGQRTVDGVLSGTSTRYEVDADTGRFDFDVITASFQKRSPGPGRLKVEIESERETVASQETTAEFGVATVSWSPQNP